MNSIIQELKYKKSIVKYELRNGVTTASGIKIDFGHESVEMLE